MVKVVPAPSSEWMAIVALGLGHDPVDRGQPEPGSGALALGGVEGLEGVVHHFGRHPGAGVADPQSHVPAGPDPRSPGHRVGVHDDVGGVDAQGAPVGHGVAGVDGQVDQYLLDLAGVGEDGPQVSARLMNSSMSAPRVRRRSSSTPLTLSLRSSTWGWTTSRRAKASS